MPKSVVQLKINGRLVGLKWNLIGIIIQNRSELIPFSPYSTDLRFQTSLKTLDGLNEIYIQQGSYEHNDKSCDNVLFIRLK